MAKSVVSLGFLLVSTTLAPWAFVFGQSLEALNSVHQFREVSISPDGAMVAWTEMILAKEGSDPRAWMVALRMQASVAVEISEVQSGAGN